MVAGGGGGGGGREGKYGWRETKGCEDHRDKTLQEDKVMDLKRRGNLGKVLRRTDLDQRYGHNLRVLKEGGRKREYQGVCVYVCV